MLPEVREGKGFAKRAPGWRAAAAERRLKGLPREQKSGKLVDPRMLRADAIAYLSHLPALSDAAHRLASVLLDHLTDAKLGTGRSTVSLTNAKLIARTGWSESKLQRSFQELEEAGLVDRYTNAAHRRSGADGLELVGLFQTSHGFRKTLGQKPGLKTHNPVTRDDLLRVVTQTPELGSNDSPADAEQRRSAIAQNRFALGDLTRAVGCAPTAAALFDMFTSVVPEPDRLADIVLSTVRKIGWVETARRAALALVWMRSGTRSAMGVAIHCLRDPSPDWRRLREIVMENLASQPPEGPPSDRVTVLRFPMTGSLEYAAGADRLIAIAREHAPGVCPDHLASTFRQYLENASRCDATGADLERMWTAFVMSYAQRRKGRG